MKGINRSRRRLSKSEEMSRVKTKNTDIELLLRRELWSLGLRYRLHFSLPGKPDIAFLGKRLAIFIDGCFWHGCPKHYTAPQRNAEFWKTKIERNILRDKLVTQQLSEQRWQVLRFWEHELKHDIQACVKQVLQTLNDK